MTRPTSADMDALLGVSQCVLDHGFIRVVDYMGNDAAIVQAARVSYGAGTKTPSDDEALIRYLMRHRHTTPLEMCELKLHLRMPIFIARQWLRHRTASANEYSARYSLMSDDFYVPPLSEVCIQSSDNKQGRGSALDEDNGEYIRERISETSGAAVAEYHRLIEAGVARETARIIMPLNSYTEFYWKINLHNLFHFLGLRMDNHAQWEIRQYAEIIFSLVEAWVPMASQAFLDYRHGGAELSAQALGYLQEMAAFASENGFQGDMKECGLGGREAKELKELLAVDETENQA